MTPDQPAAHIAEISLIGTGGGYGETVVCHLGNEHWMVVDSCMAPEGGVSLAFRYLQEIQLDLKKVKLIVCTHWHDDHIRGISQLLEACPEAELCLAWHHEEKNFQKMIRFDLEAKSKQNLQESSSTRELDACLKILTARSGQGRPFYRHPFLDSLLFIPRNGDDGCKVYSLSPTTRILDTYLSKMVDKNIELLRKSPATRLPVKHEANILSVVTYLVLGCHRALLGADLEEDNRHAPWTEILQRSNAIKGQPLAGLFKIPHHGSANAYLKAVWEKLIASQAVAKLTPWNRNQKLPDAAMIELYKEHTGRLYMTCGTNKTPAPKDRLMDQSLQPDGVISTTISYEHGHIRSRIDINDLHAIWDVAYRGEAFLCS